MARVTLEKRPAVPGLVPEALVLAPRVSDGQPPVLAVHGIQREAAEMAELLRHAAEDTGRTIVLPLFDRRHWRSFQRAACPARADLALLRLLASLREDGTIVPGAVDLSGYSGGGQFAHRFTWLYPGLVRRLCATAPGWWTFADPKAAYPYGIGAGGGDTVSTCLRANLRRFLSREIVVRVGALDTQRDDKLRVSPELDQQQGQNRLERAQRWVADIERQRTAHGLSSAVDFRVLPDSAHSFADCVAQAGLDRDFVVPSPACVPAFSQNSLTKEVA
ncbi:MAG: hypothetical protein AAFR17_02220 [Pseudomonadota bacterium]